MRRRAATVVSIVVAAIAVAAMVARWRPRADPACSELIADASRDIGATDLADRFASARCEEPTFDGWAADVLARASRVEEARSHADAAVARNPRDAHALFALALLATGTPDAVRTAERADGAGYGDDATLLVGIADLQNGDTARAAESFRRVLARDPSHVGATYDLALVADREGNYHDAREGYLATLRLDPRYADARYNLALLTYRAGALAEARHHADELAAIVPDDPRLPALRATLGSE